MTKNKPPPGRDKLIRGRHEDGRNTVRTDKEAIRIAPKIPKATCTNDPHGLGCGVPPRKEYLDHPTVEPFLGKIPVTASLPCLLGEMPSHSVSG